jgi:hypothetical protein
VPEPTGGTGPIIGLFGLFDVESLGEQIALRVARHELLRRRPGAHVRAFAPFGASRPLPFDGGEPVEPLLPADATLARALSAACRVVVLTAPEAARDPAWLAAREGAEETQAAATAGLLVDGPPGDAPRVRLDLTADAHPAVLAARVFDARLLDQRLELLRALRWWPVSGDVVVAHASTEAEVAGAAARARAAAASLGAAVRVLEVDAAERGSAERLAHALGCPAIPPVAGVEDRVAAVARSRAVVSDAPVLRALAASFGCDVVGTDGSPRPAPPAGPLAAVVDAALDAIAAHLGPDDAGPLVPGEVTALRAALEARGRRLTFERLALADHLDALRDDAAARIAARDETIGLLRHEHEVVARMWSVRVRHAAGRALRRLGVRR